MLQGVDADLSEGKLKREEKINTLNLDNFMC
jgi:hypothetical protein